MDIPPVGGVGPGQPASHTATRGRILLIQHEAATAATLQQQLSVFGYDTTVAARGAEAEALVEQTSPSLILLDLDVPDTDGLLLCSTLRARSNIPIIATHEGQENSAGILALRLGADDYVRLPIDPYELEARVDAVLRRQGRTLAPAAPVEAGLAFDQTHHRVSSGGRAVQLSVVEFALLDTLAHARTAGVRRHDLQQTILRADRQATPQALDSVLVQVGHKLALLPPPSPYIVHVPRDRYQLRRPSPEQGGDAARGHHRAAHTHAAAGW